MLMVMGQTNEKPMTTERQILTDAHGKPTHVVLTVEAFQDMEEMIPWEEAKIRVGDYRVLYLIEDDRLVVVVVKVGHTHADY
jgi:hypothetical protein